MWRALQHGSEVRLNLDFQDKKMLTAQAQCDICRVLSGLRHPGAKGRSALAAVGLCRLTREGLCRHVSVSVAQILGVR